MERYDKSLKEAMEHEQTNLTDQLKLEISIELANALIDLESNKLIVTQNYTFPMNIFFNFIESEQGYLQLSKLALANFGISSVNKKSLSSLSKTKSQIGVNEYLDNYYAHEFKNQENNYHKKTVVYRFGKVINDLFFNQKCLLIENKKDG